MRPFTPYSITAAGGEHAQGIKKTAPSVPGGLREMRPSPGKASGSKLLVGECARAPQEAGILSPVGEAH